MAGDGIIDGSFTIKKGQGISQAIRDELGLTAEQNKKLGLSVWTKILNCVKEENEQRDDNDKIYTGGSDIKGDYRKNFKVNVNQVITLSKSTWDTIVSIVNNKLKTNSLDDSQLNALNKLINNNDFKQLVGNQLMKQMLLNPKDIAKDGAVEELYKQLSQDSQKIIELLNNAGKQDSAALKSASNLSDNVNFMNQLNSMMSYVQLPLRMNQENTHGELYVYSRKKNLSSKNDNVSAFLHLDMDNLGPMDVYVALQSNKVSTNFTLADVDTLDFIEKNIHILNERLENKGYSMNTNVSVKSKSEPAKTIVKEALKMKSNGVIPEGMISKMAFDVRA